MVNLELAVIGDEYVQAVSARDLYKILDCSERFNSWMKRQLSYGFSEGVDFSGCKVFNTQANQEIDDYLMSLDMAKEISMIQRSEQGKAARRYFINCEKELQKIKEEQAKFFKFRESARLDACDFMNAVYHNSERNLCSYRDIHGAREFDLLNVIVLGMKAAEFKQRNNLPSDLNSIRDNLTLLQIEAIEYLQKADTILLEMDDLNFNERHDRLKSMFDRKFGSRFVIESNKTLLEQFS